MKNIQLQTQVKIITQEEISITTDIINIISVTDNGTEVNAIINIQDYNKLIVLWSGNDYISIGNWTDIDVENRIKEIYS